MGVTSSLLLFLLAALAIAATTYTLVSRRKKKRAQEEADRRKAELEAWRRAEGDKLRSLAATQNHIEENLQTADEERRKTEEERQRLEELLRHEAKEKERAAQEAERRAQEEALRKADGERQAAGPEGERPDPLKRGGRPRTPSKDREKQAPEETRRRGPKPEIVCWKREREWILGVEIPDELLSDSAPEIRQNSLLLAQDQSNEALWRLADVGGQVMVRWNEDHDQREARFSIEEKCLTFKLSAQTQNQ